MSLETPTWVSDFVPANPPGSDLRSQGDNHIRNMKQALQNTFPNANRAFYFPNSSAKIANYTVLATDMSKLITGDATAAAFNLTLPTLTAADDGWQFWAMKIDSSANAVTLVGTINGAANLALRSQHELVKVIWSGTAWYALRVPLSALNITGGTALTAPAVDDELPIYDLSATLNKKITLLNLLKVIDALTAETGIALDDVFALYDTSESAVNKMTPENFLKVLNLLTEDTAPVPGTDFALFYDVSASTVKKVKPANFSGMTHIATVSPAGATEADFNATNAASAFDGTYDFLEVRGDLILSSDGAHLNMRVGTGGGPTYESTNYVWISSILNSGAHSADTGAVDVIRICGGVGAAANENTNFKIEFSNPDRTDYSVLFRIFGESFASTDGSMVLRQTMGRRTTIAAMTALRILPSAGTITGVISLWGRRKA